MASRRCSTRSASSGGAPARAATLRRRRGRRCDTTSSPSRTTIGPSTSGLVRTPQRRALVDVVQTHRAHLGVRGDGRSARPPGSRRHEPSSRGCARRSKKSRISDHGDDCERLQQQDRGDDRARVRQDDGAQADAEGRYVDRDHRQRPAHAERDQPVREVPAVADVDGPVLAQPDHHDRRRVDDRQRQHDHRHQHREVGARGVGDEALEQRQRREREADEEAAAVAEEDRGRVPVEDQEPEQAADEGERAPAR